MAKVKTVYQASRDALRLHGSSLSPTAAQRSEAFRLIQDFSRFAEVACGCKASSNRAHLRRAVFHTTQDLVEDRMKNDLSHIETIARMPCPVLLPDKTMMKVKVPESAPKRIVFAGKVLRKHLSLTETQTCRGCLRRSRCKFFKAPADPELEAGVRHIGRLLLGMAQYARGHLQFPEAYPWYFTAAMLASARSLMKTIEEHVAETSSSFFYSDIEFADEGTAREIYLKEARRKEERRIAKVEERFLSLPQWMRETLQPIPGPGMTARQRSLLEQHPGLAATESGPMEPFESSEEKDWIEEGARLGELQGAPLFDPLPEVAPGRKLDPVSDRPLVEVDVGEREVVKRFHHHPPKTESSTTSRQLNSAGGATLGIYQLKEGHRIDLNEIEVDRDELQRWEEIKPDDHAVDALGQLKGGYTISQMMAGPTGSTGSTADARDVVSVSPHCLEGVHHYATGLSPKIVDPNSFEEIWTTGQRRKKKDELPFLRRLPFDAPSLETSGGALPVLPATRGGSGKARREFEEPGLEEEPGEDPVAPEPLDLDSLALEDQRLAEEALKLQQRTAVAVLEATTGEGDETRPAQAFQHRSKTRGVGVFDPQVDLRRLSDPERLSRVGHLDAETSGVYFRSARPLPTDAEFAQSFRRPLRREAAAEVEDPLGSAAPEIDIQALKLSTSSAPKTAPTATAMEDELGDIIFPSLPVASAVPAVPAPRLRRRRGGCAACPWGRPSRRGSRTICLTW